MISVNDFKTGVTVELEGQVYQVVDFQHVKPGKGAAFVRAKLKNVKSGGEWWKKPSAAVRNYIEPTWISVPCSSCTWMAMAMCLWIMIINEQITISPSEMGDGVKWLIENMSIQVLMHDTEIMGIELPNFVELLVVDTEPSVKGDTATGASKAAKLGKRLPAYRCLFS